MRAEPRHRSARRVRLPLRLVAVQVLLTLLIGAAAAAAVVSYDQMVRRAAEAQMRDTAALTEVFLRQEINRATDVLIQLARQPGTAEALQNPERAESEELIRRAILVMNLASPGQYSSLVTDGRGTVLADRPAIVPVGFDVSRRPWFTQASRAGITSDLSPVFESVVTSGLYLTTISVPVREFGRLAGVLTIVQRLDWYEQFVGSYTAARGVRLAIVDQDGRVVSDGAGRLGDAASQVQRAALGRRLLSEEDDVVRASSVAALSTGSGTWRVVAEIPGARAMRPAQIFAGVAIGAALVLVVALNLILWTRSRASAERARAAERLRESRRQLKEIADSSPDLLFRIDTTGTVRFASRSSLTVLGVAAADLVGRDLVSLLEVPAGPDLRDAIEALVLTGEPVAVVARTGPAGMRRIVEVEITAAEDDHSDQLLGSIRDVTDRRSAQDQVEQLFELTQELMAVIDFDGRLVQVNPVWERMLSRQHRDLIGRSFFLFFRFDDLVGVRAQFDLMTADGRVLEFENRYQQTFPAGGSARAMRWTMAADRDRQLVYAVGHDITQHKDLERALADARDEAIAASRTKSEFVATMSHEIRTPMNGVIGLTDLLQGTALDPNQRRYVDGVRTAGEALLSVINDILDFSKIEAGRMVLEQNDFRPREVVDDVVTLVRQSAASKGLALELDIDPAVPSVVNGDAGRLRQLLLNLAHNAVKFTASGTITLRARPATGTPPVPVLHPDLQPTIVFEVADTGIGIEPDRLEELFEPFAQADAGTSREYGGTGLGLSICRRLAALMSGTLTAGSEPGRGTTFVAELSFGRPTSAGTSRAADARSLTVLVLDADPERLEVMVAQLADWGMRSLPVSTPDEAVMALSWAGATAGGVDLAIVDLGLDPDAAASGVRLVRQVRGVPGLESVPIIAVGDQAVVTQDQLAQDLLDLGVSTVLTRPVQPSAVFDALSRVSPGGAGPLPAPVPVPELTAGPGGRRLLLVEDNEINQMVALGMLGRLGYEVDVAQDGQEALDLVSLNEYAAILMDCQMPRLDGYEATRRLRASERTAGVGRIPVVAMTAATLVSDRQRCVDAGMDDFIAKPVRFATLRETLARWLSVPEAEREAPEPFALPAQRSEGEEPADPEIAARLAELLGAGSPPEQELLRDVATSFEARAPELVGRVRAALADRDPDAVALHAHALAGAALNLGTVALAAACRRVEAEARAGRLDRAAEEAAALDAALDGDLPRLRAAVDRALTS